MARGKSTKLKPFEKLLTIMVSGKPVTLEEIDALLGNEIYMYRLSTYMWHIKVHMNGVIRANKDGRKVASYQLINFEQVKKDMDRLGITKSGYTPGQVEKKPSTAKIVTKLADLGAKPAAKKTKKTAKVNVTVPSNVAMQVAGDEIEVTEITE